MALKWDDKDPNDVDAFQIDWSERLSSETISTSVFTSTPTGLTHDSTSNTTTTTTLWLSGGTDGVIYEITNRITTTAGRTLDQTVRLRVKSR
jgi:hypothetical protein